MATVPELSGTAHYGGPLQQKVAATGVSGGSYNQSREITLSFTNGAGKTVSAVFRVNDDAASVDDGFIWPFGEADVTVTVSVEEV